MAPVGVVCQKVSGTLVVFDQDWFEGESVLENNDVGGSKEMAEEVAKMKPPRYGTKNGSIISSVETR